MILPARDYWRTHIVVPGKLHKGLDRVAYALAGQYHRRSRILNSQHKESEQIANKAVELRHTSDRRLRERLNGMQTRFRRQEKGREEALSDVLTVMV